MELTAESGKITAIAVACAFLFSTFKFFSKSGTATMPPPPPKKPFKNPIKTEESATKNVCFFVNFCFLFW